MYNDIAYIYGGINNSKNVEPLELIGFDLKTLSFFIPDNIINSREVKKRYYHSAVIFKHNMIIQGGIELNLSLIQKETVLDDCYNYNILTGVWEKIYYQGDSFDCTTGHNSVCVFNKDKYAYNQYDLYFDKNKVNISNLKNNDYNDNLIKHEGIYFFGGRNSFQDCYSKVKVLDIFKNPCELLTLKTKGRSPTPRYFASLDFYSNLNVLILYGGRNVSGKYYSDIYLLDLQKVCWISVNLTYKNLTNKILRYNFDFEDKFTINSNENKSIKYFNTLNRACHTSIIYDDRLLIIGGENEFSLMPSNILYINLKLDEIKKDSTSNNKKLGKYFRMVNK